MLGNDKFKFNFRHIGEKGSHIIFIHGVNSDSYTWDNVINYLPSNCQSWLPNLPVYGEYNTDGYCQMLVKFIKENNIESPILVGHSLGGLIALRLCHSDIKPKEVLLISTPLIKRSPLLVYVLINTLGKLIINSKIFTKLGSLILRRFKVGKNLLNKASIVSYLQCYSDIINKKINLNLREIADKKISVQIFFGAKDWYLRACGGTGLYDKIDEFPVYGLKSGHFIHQSLPDEMEIANQIKLVLLKQSV